MYVDYLLKLTVGVLLNNSCIVIGFSGIDMFDHTSILGIDAISSSTFFVTISGIFTSLHSITSCTSLPSTGTPCILDHSASTASKVSDVSLDEAIS